MNETKPLGQTKDRGFQIGVRKTLTVPAKKIWDFLFSREGLHTWLGKINAATLEPNKIYKTSDGIEAHVTTLKNTSHIRLNWKQKNWENTSALQLRVMDLNGKSTISFHQDKLLNGDQRAEMKEHWEKALEKITEFVNKA